MIDLSLTKIEIGETTLETGDLIKYFGKLSVAIRGIPSERQKIREKINPHTATLLDALNEFIDNEKKPLPKDQKLVMLVDNLDRIVPIMRGEDKNNHDGDINTDVAQRGLLSWIELDPAERARACWLNAKSLANWVARRASPRGPSCQP